MASLDVGLRFLSLVSCLARSRLVFLRMAALRRPYLPSTTYAGAAVIPRRPRRGRFCHRCRHSSHGRNRHRYRHRALNRRLDRLQRNRYRHRPSVTVAGSGLQ